MPIQPTAHQKMLRQTLINLAELYKKELKNTYFKKYRSPIFNYGEMKLPWGSDWSTKEGYYKNDSYWIHKIFDLYMDIGVKFKSVAWTISLYLHTLDLESEMYAKIDEFDSYFSQALQEFDKANYFN